MDKEALIVQLDVAMKFQMVADSTAIIENHVLNVEDLFEISFHKKKEIAFRAAWMLEYIMVHRPEQFVLHVERLFDLLPHQKNHSAMRHYGKIVALLTDKKADPVYQELIKKINFEPVIEVLFSWLVDPKTLVAAKVHAMQALANLAPAYDWIRAELLETIDYLSGIESIAFFARAKMVRKQLNRK